MDRRHFTVVVYRPGYTPYGKEVIRYSPYDAAQAVVEERVRPGTKIVEARWHFMARTSDGQWIEVVVDELPKV